MDNTKFTKTGLSVADVQIRCSGYKAEIEELFINENWRI